MRRADRAARKRRLGLEPPSAGEPPRRSGRRRGVVGQASGDPACSGLPAQDFTAPPQLASPAGSGSEAPSSSEAGSAYDPLAERSPSASETGGSSDTGDGASSKGAHGAGRGVGAGGATTPPALEADQEACADLQLAIALSLETCQHPRQGSSPAQPDAEQSRTSVPRCGTGAERRPTGGGEEAGDAGREARAPARRNAATKTRATPKQASRAPPTRRRQAGRGGAVDVGPADLQACFSVLDTAGRGSVDVHGLILVRPAVRDPRAAVARGGASRTADILRPGFGVRPMLGRRGGVVLGIHLTPVIHPTPDAGGAGAGPGADGIGGGKHAAFCASSAGRGRGRAVPSNHRRPVLPAGRPAVWPALKPEHTAWPRPASAARRHRGDAAVSSAGHAY